MELRRNSTLNVLQITYATLQMSNEDGGVLVSKIDYENIEVRKLSENLEFRDLIKSSFLNHDKVPPDISFLRPFSEKLLKLIRTCLYGIFLAEVVILS